MTQYESKEQTRDSNSPETGKSDVEQKKAKKSKSDLKWAKKIQNKTKTDSKLAKSSKNVQKQSQNDHK